MQWIEVTIHTNTQGADAMADVFFSMGITGVSIEDAADIALYQRESDEWDYIDESIFADRGEDVQGESVYSGRAGRRKADCADSRAGGRGGLRAGV